MVDKKTVIFMFSGLKLLLNTDAGLLNACDATGTDKKNRILYSRYNTLKLVDSHNRVHFNVSFRMGPYWQYDICTI